LEGFGLGSLASSCEHGYEPSDFIRSIEFLDQLSNTEELFSKEVLGM
jgi:hypothetical protein